MKYVHDFHNRIEFRAFDCRNQEMDAARIIIMLCKPANEQTNKTEATVKFLRGTDVEQLQWNGKHGRGKRRRRRRKRISTRNKMRMYYSNLKCWK